AHREDLGRVHAARTGVTHHSDRTLGVFPSPVYGGGIGRGHANREGAGKKIERGRSPPPHPPPPGAPRDAPRRGDPVAGEGAHRASGELISPNDRRPKLRGRREDDAVLRRTGVAEAALYTTRVVPGRACRSPEARGPERSPNPFLGKIVIPGESRPRFLRVVTLEDGETVHNAFFDRNFREEER